MKSNAILVFLIALLAVSVAVVSASDMNVTINTVSISGVENPTLVSGTAGEVIPVKVIFSAGEELSDVRVKVFVSGYRDDVSASTSRFKIFDGVTYSKLLSLTLPSDIDPEEDFTLTVRIESKTKSIEQEKITLKIQRESYNLEVLSIDTARSISAGSVLSVDVVLKNRGIERLDDTFVIARIPSLDIEKKVYFSDLTAVDEEGDNDKEDANAKTIYLQIPSDVKAGVYTLEVEAYNADSSAKVTKSILVSGLEQGSDVLTAVTSKDVGAGTSVTYDLIIVNSGNRIATYEIVPETAQNLIVTVDEPIVAVPADSSQVVKVRVQAGNVMGTFNFAVNVNSQGQLVKRVNLAANVGKAGLASNIVVLTVVLAIIFVVLLIVLIVLLTRKPVKSEEFGESYY